jgi:outer membrane receptor for ferrienterochelin and colicins
VIPVLPELVSRFLVFVRCALPVLAMMAVSPRRVSAQVGRVRGVVVDSATAVPIGGVHVALIPDARSAATEMVLTAEDGSFSLPDVPGPCELVFSRIGYAPLRLRLESPSVPVQVRLAALEVPLDPVVVSVSRSEQAALGAPAALSVLDRTDLVAAVGFTPVDQLSTVPGVDVARKGLLQSEFAVRGASGVNSAGALMLTDFRYAEVPSIGFNIPYLIPASLEDIERIEVVRGPGAALYGPGAARGVVHVITRSPFESRGGTVSVTMGDRSVVEEGFRYAAALGPRVAFAVSGDYFYGHDWQTRDTTEDNDRQAALASGALADTLRIGRRDFQAGRGRGELRIDWRPGPATSVVARAGAAEAVRAIDLTSEIGAVQVRDWRYSFVQATVRHARLFANVQYDQSNAGSTYALRTGDPLVDYSRVAAGQLQHGVALGAVELLYGADVRWTDPRTGGTIDGAYENHDRVTETGAYAHATTRLSHRFDLVTALRVDRHDRLNDLVVSPRAALVFKPGRAHAFRLTFNRAFSSPDPSDLFADILAEHGLEGLPYDVRAASIPQHGFTFHRDCGGLCMRSPFNPAGAGQYVPADATQWWSAVVDIASRKDVDLSSIPQPNATQVGTVLAALNTYTKQFEPLQPGDVRDVPALRRTITSSLELGYRGVTAGRLGIALDLYWNRVQDPLGDRYTLTPNVFLDRATLAQYLGSYMSAAEAAQVSAMLAQIPLGTVSPSQAPHPADILVVRSQGGRYTLWGTDLSVSAALGGGWSAAASFSWVSTNAVGQPGTLTGFLLNIPRTKGTLSVSYRGGAWAARLRGRAVSEFPVASGQYKGSVPAYGLMDAMIGYRLERGSETTLTLEAQNVLNRRHVEMVGAPAIGRLVVGRLRLML